MNWHQKQTNQILRHAGDHRNHTRSGTHDLSCKICYPKREEETDKRFQLFWDWYQEVTTVQEFSGKTKEIFREIMSKNQENIIEGRENTRISALIYSMRYQDNSGFLITDIRARIMTMTAVSEKFTRDMDEATRSYKTESSKDNSPEKEESPKRNSPKVEGSKINEKEVLEIQKELEKLENQEIEKWDTSTGKMIDDDEMERMRLNLELRRIRRMERAKSIDEVESIKSEGLNSIKSEDLARDSEDDIIAGKYRRIKERMGNDLDKMITEMKETNKEYFLQNIRELEEKDSLTREEIIRLEDLKKANKEEFTKEIIENLYNATFKEEIATKEKEKGKLPEIFELERDEELFQKRYKQKKEKYDKIKERIGDEIDEELIKAKERLHEDITRRIKYYEEKEMLTMKEAQELEDLKRPEKLDEEELTMEEYVIHEIYEEQFNKKNDEDIKKPDTKGKNKEIEKPLIKLELEKEDEYTTETVDDFKDYLNERYGRTEDINLKDFIKGMGIESAVNKIDKIREKEKKDEEIKIEPENTSDIEEKVINTAEILSASESSESEEYFEEENKEFELYLGDQDLNLGNLFEENFEIFEMALDHGVKCRTFGGKSDESLEEWIDEFERVADFNNWAPDAIDRARAAGVYLRGEALEVYKTISGTAVDNLRWDHGADGVKLKLALQAEFETPGRQREKIRKYYQVKQEPGESVSDFAIRFKGAARKVGNNVADDEKIMDFIERLLPAVKPWANVGNQNTLEEAITSAKKGEQNVMGYAKQIIPEQTYSNNENRIYQEMKKEKSTNDVDNLVDQFYKKMEIRMLQQENRGNYQISNGNYQRNNGNYQGNANRRCYECDELGHIRPNCPNVNRTQGNRNNNNNTGNYNRNNNNNTGNYN